MNRPLYKGVGITEPVIFPAVFQSIQLQQYGWDIEMSKIPVLMKYFLYSLTSFTN